MPKTKRLPTARASGLPSTESLDAKLVGVLSFLFSWSKTLVIMSRWMYRSDAEIRNRFSTALYLSWSLRRRNNPHDSVLAPPTQHDQTTQQPSGGIKTLTTESKTHPSDSTPVMAMALSPRVVFSFFSGPQ